MTKKLTQKEKQSEATRLLSLHGIDMEKSRHFDYRPTGQRLSVFKGRVTAVWHEDHFKKEPFGTFPVVE